MRFSLTLLITFAALALAERDSESKRGTWYSDWSRGNCGIKNHDKNYVSALRTEEYYANEKRCGELIKVTNLDNGKSVITQFVDQCDVPNHGCSTDIDLSQPAFKLLAPLSKGKLKVKYEWVTEGKPGDSGKGISGERVTAKKPSSEEKKKEKAEREQRKSKEEEARREAEKKSRKAAEAKKAEENKRAAEKEEARRKALEKLAAAKETEATVARSEDSESVVGGENTIAENAAPEPESDEEPSIVPTTKYEPPAEKSADAASTTDVDDLYVPEVAGVTPVDPPTLPEQVRDTCFLMADRYKIDPYHAKKSLKSHKGMKEKWDYLDCYCFVIARDQFVQPWISDGKMTSGMRDEWYKNHCSCIVAQPLYSVAPGSNGTLFGRNADERVKNKWQKDNCNYYVEKRHFQKFIDMPLAA